MDNTLHITKTAQNHIRLVAQRDKIPPILRVKVDSGGCSGFKYIFEFVDVLMSDDYVFEREEVKIIVDPISWSFLIDCQLDFIEEMMGSYFIIKNPNAQSSCGCGSSFSI